MEREKRRNEPAWIAGCGAATRKSAANAFGCVLRQIVCIRVTDNSELP